MSKLFFLIIWSALGMVQVKKESKVTIQVSGITSREGYLMLEMKNEHGKVVNRVRQQATNSFIRIMAEPGKYAVAAYLDLNGDSLLNCNLFGVPVEPYGFSNDVRGRFGPPRLSEQLFEVNKNTQITIKLR